MNELAIISLLFSLLFVELTGIAPGGIIVPFYFVLYLDEPLKMAATVLAAALSVGIVRLLSNVTILYGRRRFALYIVVGILLKVLFTYLYTGPSYMFFDLSMTIGHLVPGILGSTMERQGVVKTTLALAAVTVTVRLLQVLLMG